MSTERDEKTTRFNQKSFEVAAQHSPQLRHGPPVIGPSITPSDPLPSPQFVHHHHVHGPAAIFLILKCDKFPDSMDRADVYLDTSQQSWAALPFS